MDPINYSGLSSGEVAQLSEAEYRSAIYALEEENRHSEVWVLEAKRTGNPDFVVRAESLHTQFLKAGHYSNEVFTRHKQLIQDMREHAAAGQSRERMKG